MSHREPALLNGKTAIWLLMLTVIILFGTLTFTFVASVPSNISLPVPLLFYLNTLLLIISSVMLHRAMILEKQSKAAPWLIAALVSGLGFIAFQLYAWFQMVQLGLTLSSGGRVVSYLYVFSGLHGLHILGGLIFVFVVSRQLRNGKSGYLEMATWFWHFLGMLWIFLLAIIALHT